MNPPIIQLQPAPILRARIRELRQELSAITEAYRVAKKGFRSDTIAPLLRRKSELVRQLIEAQSQLIAALRAEAQEPVEETLAETS